MCASRLQMRFGWPTRSILAGEALADHVPALAGPLTNGNDQER
jgi:hypothetical protein